MEILRRRPQREIQNADADGLERIRKCLAAFPAESLTPCNNSNARDQANYHTAGGVEPAAIKRILQEIGNANQDRNDPDPVQPQLADSAFQVLRRTVRFLGKLWRRNARLRRNLRHGRWWWLQRKSP